MNKQRKIKGFIVRAGVVPYTPAEYLGVYTIFRTKKDAEYWRDTRVHEGNRKEVIECTISFNISTKKRT